MHAYEYYIYVRHLVMYYVVSFAVTLYDPFWIVLIYGNEERMEVASS